MKLSITEFSHNQMVAKLFILQRNWCKSFSEVTVDDVTDYCAKFAKDNFIYPPEREHSLIEHLAVYLMGGKSIFDKFI